MLVGEFSRDPGLVAEFRGDLTKLFLVEAVHMGQFDGNVPIEVWNIGAINYPRGTFPGFGFDLIAAD